jgi:phosphate/sulfate permease
MVDKGRLGRALIQYTTVEVIFILVVLPMLLLLLPFLVAGYTIYMVVGIISILGGITTVFIRNSIVDDSYSMPQEFALILSPIIATPIFSGLVGAALFAINKKEQVENELEEEKEEIEEEMMKRAQEQEEKEQDSEQDEEAEEGE